MADFATIHALAITQAFVDRVKVAAMLEADRVGDELPATAYHAKRVDYGTLFVRVPDAEAPKLALACAAHARIAGVQNDATDNNIVLALRDYWNVFAGVVTT